jgi:hypothetical protein
MDEGWAQAIARKMVRRGTMKNLATKEVRETLMLGRAVLLFPERPSAETTTIQVRLWLVILLTDAYWAGKKAAEAERGKP